MKLVFTTLYTSFHVIQVNREEIQQLTGSDSKRIIVELNGRKRIHVAIQNSKEIGHYLYIGKDTMQELQLRNGSEIDVRFFADTTPIQFEIPEEFMQLLENKPLAQERFDSLTDGAKRGIFHYINKLKSPEKRIEKSVFVLDKLLQGFTSIQQMLKK